MRIVLPYIGSKKRLIDAIEPNLPPSSVYIEPFAGGFSLGLTLMSRGSVGKTVLNDIKKDVVNFWSVVKEDGFNLSENIYSLLDKVDDSYSTGIEVDLKTDNDFAAHFYLRQKSAYGRDVKKVAYGMRLNAFLGDIFTQAQSLLVNTDITNLDYEDLKFYDSFDSFWYLDPPYHSYDNSLFYGVESSETDFNHQRLAEFVKTLDGRFILSNADTPEVHAMYSDFYIYPIKVRSGLARSFSDEVLISNYPLTIPEKFFGIEKYVYEDKERTVVAVPPFTFGDLLDSW